MWTDGYGEMRDYGDQTISVEEWKLAEQRRGESPELYLYLCFNSCRCVTALAPTAAFHPP